MKWHKSIGLKGRAVVGSYQCVNKDLPGLGISVWCAQRWGCGFLLVLHATSSCRRPVVCELGMGIMVPVHRPALGLCCPGGSLGTNPEKGMGLSGEGKLDE